MRKISSFVAMASLVLGLVSPGLAGAEVTVTAAPASLAADPLLVKASSAPVPLFSVSLNATATETMASLAVVVNPNATTTVTGSDIANISVYKDDGNGSFNAAGDSLLASNSAVQVSTSTMVNLGSSTPATGRFFVTLATAGSWSDAAPADSIRVTMPANGITTSAGAASTSAVTTASITADTTAPMLTSVVAKNTGGTDAKEVGDSIALNFSEPTNKPAITAANISSFFTVNNGHSFLDASSTVGSIAWDVTGKVLTVTLGGSTTSTTTLASIQPTDVVAVNNNASFTDLAGNQASGTQSVTGSFAGTVPGNGSNEEQETKGACANSLLNGRLYKVGNSPTVYLAAACRLKPFRGNAVFKARGQKFQDIITLSSMPANVSVSESPVLPAAGTLVKGSDRTVWFVTKDGARRGFVSGDHFRRLGFGFDKVQAISDSDLQLIPSTSPIETNETHPDGSLVKCSATPAIYQVIGKTKFPFANADAFRGKGHTFEHVLVVDCGTYQYPTGAPITQ